MTNGNEQGDMTTIAPPRPSRMVLLLGSLCVFGSAFCFYFSTVVIRWASADTQLDVSFFAFFRFLLGFFSSAP